MILKNWMVVLNVNAGGTTKTKEHGKYMPGHKSEMASNWDSCKDRNGKQKMQSKIHIVWFRTKTGKYLIKSFKCNFLDLTEVKWCQIKTFFHAWDISHFQILKY